MPLRFVLLEHDHPFAHLDFMLEQGDALWTWRLEQLPRLGVPLPAQRLPDHRLIYLDYEGPVSGNRGRVVRLDRGVYDLLTHQSDTITLRLQEGQLLRGILCLAQLEGDRWSCTLCEDS